MNKFEEIAKKKGELDQMIKSYGEEALKEYFNEFFDANPTVTAIRWQQYTPYFNDGDPCVFGVNQPYIRLQDGDEGGGDYEDGFLSTYDLTDYSKIPPGTSWQERGQYIEYRPEYHALKKLEGTLCSNEQVLLSVFGDHAEITVDRDKMTVDEYYHD